MRYPILLFILAIGCGSEIPNSTPQCTEGEYSKVLGSWIDQFGGVLTFNENCTGKYVRTDSYPQNCHAEFTQSTEPDWNLHIDVGYVKPGSNPYVCFVEGEPVCPWNQPFDDPERLEIQCENNNVLLEFTKI